MTRAPLLALLTLLTGCETAGPGAGRGDDEKYVYHNDHNSLALITIDGHTKPFLAYDETRGFNLSKLNPHTVEITYGNYTTMIAANGHFYQGWQTTGPGPTFTIEWTPERGWKTTPQP